jgi:mannose-1-phosphate guanylyltransferase
MDLYAVVMAGGSGTRFWPLSRRALPKQLLPLWEGRTLTELTVERLNRLVPLERLLIVTGEHLAAAIAEAAPQVPSSNIVVEPRPRNTLPCIALAAEVVRRRDPDAVLGVFPADHFIADVDGFASACRRAETSARRGPIATLGIRPTRPETGYGYIRHAGVSSPQVSEEALPVEAFVEKPDAPTAVEYLEDGRYLWNAGIFFMQLATLDRELARQQPQLEKRLPDLRAALASGDREALDRCFAGLPSISIDYGVMEGAAEVSVVAADVGWSDVGHWGALDAVLQGDDEGNIRIGRVLAVDCRDSVVINRNDPGKVIAVLGARDLVVVDTPDVLLVVPKRYAQRVRELVARAQPEFL